LPTSSTHSQHPWYLFDTRVDTKGGGGERADNGPQRSFSRVPQLVRCIRRLSLWRVSITNYVQKLRQYVAPSAILEDELIFECWVGHQGSLGRQHLDGRAPFDQLAPFFSSAGPAIDASTVGLIAASARLRSR